MAFTDEEIREFKTEADELLDSAEKSLLSIDKGDPFASHYDSIFRVFHSLKGAAGMMEMNELQAHMHQLENIFTEQKSKKTVEKSYIDLFLRGTDAARSILAGKAVKFDYQIKAESRSPEKKASLPPSTPPSQPQTPVRGKVIIVDDEPDIVKLMVDILTDAGLEATGTVDPQQLLELVRSVQPDVVVTDISMPGISGVQILSTMTDKFPEIPVIFVSGFVTKDLLLEAIESGVYGVIEKPFEAARVVGYCLNAVQKHRLTKLLNGSINLIMYQFSDLDEFLKSQGKEDIRKSISREINSLLDKRRQLKAMKKKVGT